VKALCGPCGRHAHGYIFGKYRPRRKVPVGHAQYSVVFKPLSFLGSGGCEHRGLVLGVTGLLELRYPRGGQSLNFVVTNGEIRLQPKVYAGLLQVGLQIHQEIDVPKGDLYLRTGTYDLGSNTAGTLGAPWREATTPTAAAK
jgi:hypothetical protein